MMLERLARLIPARFNPWSPTTGATRLNLPEYSRGSSNIEIFKFGMYIMFPIGWMWYFGTNLENRFSVPDFWPEAGTTNKIPFERKEQRELLEQLRANRLEKRRRRLELEARFNQELESPDRSLTAEQGIVQKTAKPLSMENKNDSEVGAIDGWATGKP